MMKAGTKKLVTLAMALCMALSLMAVGVFGNSSAKAENEITIASADTLSGSAALTLTRNSAHGEEEKDPLEIYVDHNRVYRGPYADNIVLDTTRLKNGDSRILKAVYKTSEGTITASKTVAIANDGGDEVADPVQVITPQMMADFEWKNSSTVTVSDDGSYATITNCNIADPNTLTVDFGTADAPNTIEIGGKFHESNEAGTVRRVRFRISSSTAADGSEMTEANFDWAFTDYNGDLNEFDGINLREVAGAESNRAAICGNASLDVTIMSDGGATLKVEYVTVASYSPVSLAVVDGAPRVAAADTALDLFGRTDDVTFEVNANGNALTAVTGPYNAEGGYLTDEAITDADYTLTDGIGEGERATIKLSYLKKLSVGKKYFRIENASGYAEVSIDLTDTTPIPVESVEITDKITAAMAGDIYNFTVAIDPVNATDPAIVWSVSDDTVAAVDQASGAVKFLKAGTVKITVTVTGKKVTGEEDEPKADSFDVTVTESSIVPVIVSPEYNAQVKNSLLVEVEKQVNDETDEIEAMLVYVGERKVYEGDYVPAFSIDTTKFANGLTDIRIEFDTAKSDENTVVQTQVHIANDEHLICYPTLAGLSAIPVDNADSVMAAERDMDGKLLGVRFTQTGGSYAGFRAWTTPVAGVDFTRAEDIVMSFSVRSFEGVDENSKIYTQIVVQNPNGIGRDIGINGLLDIKEAGRYSITLKEIFDREIAEERLPDYALLSSLTNAQIYYVILIEGKATAVVEQFALNYKFDDTDVDYSDVVTLPKSLAVLGESEKNFDLYTDTADVTFEIDSNGLDITIEGSNINLDAYSFSSTTLTIFRSYLLAIGAGDHVYTISSGVGTPVTVTIHVTDSTPAAPQVVGNATADFSKDHPADVSFTLDLHGATLTSVTGSDITAADYTIDANGKFTIHKEFLLTCANGERTFRLTTAGGFVNVKVNISAATGGKDKGCGANVASESYLLAALALILGAAALTIAKTKKK